MKPLLPILITASGALLQLDPEEARWNRCQLSLPPSTIVTGLTSSFCRTTFAAKMEGNTRLGSILTTPARALKFKWSAPLPVELKSVLAANDGLSKVAVFDKTFKVLARDDRGWSSMLLPKSLTKLKAEEARFDVKEENLLVVARMPFRGTLGGGSLSVFNLRGKVRCVFHQDNLKLASCVVPYEAGWVMNMGFGSQSLQKVGGHYRLSDLGNKRIIPFLHQRKGDMAYHDSRSSLRIGDKTFSQPPYGGTYPIHAVPDLGVLYASGYPKSSWLNDLDLIGFEPGHVVLPVMSRKGTFVWSSSPLTDPPPSIRKMVEWLRRPLPASSLSGQALAPHTFPRGASREGGDFARSNQASVHERYM